VPRAGATSDRPCSQNDGGLLILFKFPSCVTSPVQLPTLPQPAAAIVGV